MPRATTTESKPDPLPRIYLSGEAEEDAQDLAGLVAANPHRAARYIIALQRGMIGRAQEAPNRGTCTPGGCAPQPMSVPMPCPVCGHPPSISLGDGDLATVSCRETHADNLTTSGFTVAGAIQLWNDWLMDNGPPGSRGVRLKAIEGPRFPVALHVQVAHLDDEEQVSYERYVQQRIRRAGWPESTVVLVTDERVQIGSIAVQYAQEEDL